MKKRIEVVLNQAELKTLRRVFNALASVPFTRTPKPAFDLTAIEQRLRLAAQPADVALMLDINEIELMLKALDAVSAEFPIRRRLSSTWVADARKSRKSEASLKRLFMPPFKGRDPGHYSQFA